MSEDSDKREKDEELEGLLRQLVPAPLNVHLVAKLNRDREITLFNHEQSPARIQWRRVVPLTLVGSLAMVGFGFLRYGDHFSQPVKTAEPLASVAEPLAGIKKDHFLPVSAHGFLMNTSSGGVIQTEDGPRERVTLEYQDAYHWHDPESGTNIRLFQPRRDEVIVPLQTD